MLGVFAQLASRNKAKLKFLLMKRARALSLAILLIAIILPSNLFKFPELWLSIPLLAAAHISYFGANKSQDSRFFFDSQILNYIGDRSYFIYLWHWPAIVLAKYLFPQSRVALVLALCIGVAISLVTYSKIENPIRKQNYRNLKVLMAYWVTFALIPLLASALLGYVSSNISFKKYESGEIQGHYQGDIGAIGFDSFSSEYPPVCTVSILRVKIF
jgi:peptidoglycan/LPS O-acetylase OafA/YrhL